eukprot:2866925-Rhodomonas_salina.3
MALLRRQKPCDSAGHPSSLYTRPDGPAWWPGGLRKGGEDELGALEGGAGGVRGSGREGRGREGERKRSEKEGAREIENTPCATAHSDCLYIRHTHRLHKWARGAPEWYEGVLGLSTEHSVHARTRRARSHHRHVVRVPAHLHVPSHVSALVSVARKARDKQDCKREKKKKEKKQTERQTPAWKRKRLAHHGVFGVPWRVDEVPVPRASLCDLALSAPRTHVRQRLSGAPNPVQTWAAVYSARISRVEHTRT